MTVSRIPLTQDDLQRISHLMGEMIDTRRKKTIMTKKDAITFLEADIRNLLQHKWTLQEVCGFLTEQGIEITVPTLSVYLTRLKLQQR